MKQRRQISRGLMLKVGKSQRDMRIIICFDLASVELMVGAVRNGQPEIMIVGALGKRGDGDGFRRFGRLVP